ncbi:glycerate kinase family protein [Laedolimicola intestinihominis]|uniref:Glycerate kinase n=1 Tax=Laedolimicola intestinihominis TaxID=3133166 RepID=A0ABV1FLU0_9FIRM
MKFLFASDSLKGTLSSDDTGRLLAKAAKEVFPACICEGIPVADGGEGTVDAVIRAVQGQQIRVKAQDPLMQTRETYYGKLDENRAIIEMALASGYALVPAEKRNPLYTSSYGTGELIRDALDRGFRDITIAIGGSATNDGGMGCMRALGVRFLDRAGRELMGNGSDLGRLAAIDDSGLDPRIADAVFTVMCDVTNPLCGENGATYTFGPQKGATPEILERLERGMENYRDILIRTYDMNPDTIPGSGAAGGLGAALLVFLRAQLKSGIETVLDLIEFDRRLKGVSLVVTGEGCTDWQSCYGKVVQGVGDRCRKHNVPAVALVGGMGEGAEQIYEHGIRSIVTTVNGIMPPKEAFKNAEILYYQAALRLFRLLKTGMELGI